MEVTVSDKYQVVIPKAVRQQLQLKPGQKVQVTRRAKMIVINTGSDVENDELNKKAVAMARAYGPSYSALAREWDTPEEDAAWAHLQ